MILLPTPQITGFRMVPVRASNDLRSSLGGSTQRIIRFGTRFASEVSLAAMKRVPDGEDWVGALNMGYDSTVRMPLPMPEEGVPAAGTPLVNGAGQLGMVLNIDGLTPNYAFRRGQWISITVNGVKAVHMVSAAITADASGVVALPIYPMLRGSPANNTAVDVEQPFIEGLLDGDAGAWTIEAAEYVGLSFVITENR